MKNKEELLKKFSKEVKMLERWIDHPKLYSIRNFVASCLIKCGIALDYAFPFILSTFIVAYVQIANDNSPFQVADVIERAEVETIDTSSGIHMERISYDYTYEEESIEYSTGWIVNEVGLYERTITSYRINRLIDMSDTEKLFSMSKEEIDRAFFITDIKTICKSSLSPEDYIYDSDAFILINHGESDDEFISRKETEGENLFRCIWFIFLSFAWGNAFGASKDLFVKTYIRDKLRGVDSFLCVIDEDELERLKKVLELKKENLSLIDPSSEDNKDDSAVSYVLRKPTRRDYHE